MKKEILFYLLVIMMLTVSTVKAETDKAEIGESKIEEPVTEEVEIKTYAVRIEASEYKFVTSGSLKLAEPAVLTFVNKGEFTHEFESDLFQGGEVRVESGGVTTVGDSVREIVIAPGKTVAVYFVPIQGGKVEFFCRQKEPKDHFKEGMHGVITVQEE